MFLTVHSASGILIGQTVTNPLWAFFVGLFSHYILDIIPHGDEIKFKSIGISELAKLAIIDHIFVVLNLLLLFYFKPHLFITIPIITALIGSMLPDWLYAIYKLSGKIKSLEWLNNILKPAQKFHRFCHRRIIKYECSFPVGIIIQIITLGIFWWMI